MALIQTTIVDSIAVSLLDQNALLTAIGNELHLHRAATMVPHEAHPDRHQSPEQLGYGLRCKVHGIVTGSGINARKMLVFGEKEFILLAWQVPEYRFELLYRGQLSDWINTATFENDCQQFVLHTAHSVLLRFSYTVECSAAVASVKGIATLLEMASCTDKSTLYTAHLHGKSWHQLVVFGGNAFGELLIWQPKDAVKCASKRKQCPLLHRISAHNGVIFSIDYNAQAQLLITTSDDRSIKFWCVEFVARGLSDWRSAKLRAEVSGYAHVARVFCGRIIVHSGTYYAITAGEDSHFSVWRTNGDLLFKRREHFGATIWNLAYDAECETLYTVGATGNVMAYGLQTAFEQPAYGITTRTVAAIKNQNCSAKEDVPANEYMAKVKFLTADLLIGVTSRNRLLYTDLAAGTSSWQPVDDQHGSYKCTVVEVHENLFVVCGFQRATLYEYVAATRSFRVCYDAPLLDGVIRAFQFLNANVYLASDELGNCLMLKGKDFGIRITLTLPACKEPWLTTALLIHGAIGGTDLNTDVADSLLASSRNGNLLLFRGVGSDEAHKFVLTQKLRQPHGYQGATVMRIVHSTPHAHFIRSAGRDGCVKLLRLCRRTAQLTISTQHLVPVAWVEASVQLEQAEILLGFNDNRFVAWSRDHDFLLQHACGGGHRCWHYRMEWEPHTSNYRLFLAFIKQKQVLYHQVPLFNVCRSRVAPRARSHWHVRACNALRVCITDMCVRVIVSAGDDNLIKVSKLTTGGRLWQLHELHTHISNVRCVHLQRLSAAECLIFSGGGRAQLCIARLQLSDVDTVGGVQELSNYTLKPPVQLVTPAQAFKPDAELRIMSLDVSLAKGGGYLVYVGCSDGYLRLLQWQPTAEAAAPTFVQLREIYFGRCLLQVRLLGPLALVAATDGILHCYSRDLAKELLQFRVHDSGISALDALLVDGVLHVLTGGDDQAVVYAQVALELVSESQPPALSLQRMRSYRQLHTAQVTGVALRRISDSSDSQSIEASTLYAYTCGVDQNLNVYDLGTETLVRSLHICVADVKGLTIATSGTHGFLFGCGLQIFSL